MKWLSVVLISVVLVGCKPSQSSPEFTGGYRLDDGSVALFWSDGQTVILLPEEVAKIKEHILPELEGKLPSNLPTPQKERVAKYVQDIAKAISSQELPKLQTERIEDLVQDSERVRDEALAALQKVEGEISTALDSLNEKHWDNLVLLKTKITDMRELLDEINQKIPTDYNTAKEEVEQLHASVNLLQTQLNSLLTAWNSLAAAKKGLPKSIDETTKDINSVAAQVTAAEEKLKDINQIQKDLESRLAASKQKLESLTQENDSLESRISQEETRRQGLATQEVTQETPLITPSMLASLAAAGRELPPPRLEGPPSNPDPDTDPEPDAHLVPLTGFGYRYYSGSLPYASSGPQTEVENMFPPEMMPKLERAFHRVEKWGLGEVGPYFAYVNGKVRIGFEGVLNASTFIQCCRVQQGDPACLAKCVNLLRRTGPNDQFIIRSEIYASDPSKVTLTVGLASQPWPNSERWQSQQFSELAHMFGHVVATLKAEL